MAHQKLSDAILKLDGGQGTGEQTSITSPTPVNNIQTYFNVVDRTQTASAPLGGRSWRLFSATFILRPHYRLAA